MEATSSALSQTESSSCTPNEATNKLLTQLNNSEKPNLLIGLKYDALIGNLYVNILKGSNLYDRQASDKSPSNYLNKSY